jgi:hypothetical protein
MGLGDKVVSDSLDETNVLHAWGGLPSPGALSSVVVEAGSIPARWFCFIFILAIARYGDAYPAIACVSITHLAIACVSLRLDGYRLQTHQPMNRFKRRYLMNDLKHYGAVIGHARVMTVWASNKAEAKRKVRRQLNKPSRKDVYRRWRSGGEKVTRLKR